MKLKTEFVAGKKTQNEWSGVYGNVPDTESVLSEYGEMYATVRIKTDVKDFELGNFAKIITNQLQQAYYEDLKNFKSTMDRLEESVWKMKSRMDIILSKEDEILEKGIDLEMAILLFKGSSLYFVTIGESKAFVSRDGDFLDLSSVMENNPKTEFFKSASLKTEEEDRFLIATSDISNLKMDLEEALRTLDINQFKENDQELLSIMMIGNEELDWKENKKLEIKEEVVEQEDITTTMPKISEEEKQEENEINKEIETKEEMEALVQEESNIEALEENLNDNSEKEELLDENLETDLEYEDGETTRFQDLTEKSKEKLSIFATAFGNKVSQIKERVRPTDSSPKSVKPTQDDIYDEYDEDFDKEEAPSLSERLSFLLPVKNFFVNTKNKVVNHFEDNQTTYAHFVNTAFGRIKNTVIKIYEFFRAQVLGTGPTDRRFISKNKRRVQRNRLIFGVTIVILAIFLFTTINSRVQSSKINGLLDDYEADVVAAEEDLNFIEQSVQTSAANDATAKARIKNDIESLQADLKTINAPIDVDQDNERLVNLKSRLTTVEEAIELQFNSLFAIETFSDPQVVSDLATQFQNTELTDLEYEEGALFVSDAGRNVIYKIGTQLESVAEVHVSDLVEPQVLAKNYAGEIIVVDRSSDSRIGRFNVFDNESYVKYPGLSVEETGDIDDAAVYQGNGALYEIHSNLQQIFKRDKLGDEFAGGGAVYDSVNPPNWRTDSTYSNAIDIEVPGEIYLLTSGIGLTRHLAGGDNNLTFDLFNNFLQEDYNTLQNATAFDINDRYLIIGDSIDQKIYVFEVSAELGGPVTYKKQFQYSGNLEILTDIKEIQINDGNNEFYVLDGSRILRFGL